MNTMHTTGATEVRKNWSSICDSVARVRPSVIKRTHDYLYLASKDSMISLLADVKYRVSIYKEEDRSYTVVSDNMDLAENAGSKEEALMQLAAAILDYAEEYFENYPQYSISPNRRPHLPYITKAFLLDDANKIREEMLCQNGRS